MKKTENVTTKNTDNKDLLNFLAKEGLSQAGLAKKIGVQRATVNGWVKQGKQPTCPILLRIATYFNKSPEQVNDLLGFNVNLQDYKDDTVPLKIQVRGLELRVAALTEMVKDLISA